MKNIFSIKLYLFGIKNLKNIGFIAFFSILFLNVSHLIVKDVIYLFTPEFFAPLCLTIFVFIPFFVYYAFSHFDFKKGESLFYGLPKKRFTYFTSFTFSIFTWVALIIIANCVIIAAASLVGKWNSFYMGMIGNFFDSLLYYLFSAFLVTSIFIFAKSVSSKTHTWLVISVILLIFPLKFADVYLTDVLDESNTATQLTLWGNLFDFFRSPLEEFSGLNKNAISFRTKLFGMETIIFTFLSFLFFFLKKTSFYKKTIVDFFGKSIFVTLAVVPLVVDYFFRYTETHDIKKSAFFSCLFIFTLAFAIMIFGKISKKNLCVSAGALAVSFALSLLLAYQVSPIAKRLDLISYTADDIETAFLCSYISAESVYQGEYIGPPRPEAVSHEAKEMIYNVITSETEYTHVKQYVWIKLKDGRSEYRILRLKQEEQQILHELCELSQ